MLLEAITPRDLPIHLCDLGGEQAAWCRASVTLLFKIRPTHQGVDPLQKNALGSFR